MPARDPRQKPGVVARTLEAMLRSYARVAPSDRGCYQLVQRVRRTIPRPAWKREFKIPGGLRYRLDLAEFPDFCMAYGLFEREVERVMKRILRPGDHFVDGGANIGYFTLKAAQLVGPKGRVDAFEPQPDNRLRLIEHIAMNLMADRIRVHDVALSEHAGTATIHFYLDEAGMNHGCSTILPRAGAHTRSTEVNTVRMDEILKGTTLKLVKLDIEGFEPFAVAGMTGLLQNPNPPAIILEWGEHPIPAPFDARGAVGELLKVVPDYRVFVIGAKLQPVDPTAEALKELKNVNLLLTRE